MICPLPLILNTPQLCGMILYIGEYLIFRVGLIVIRGGDYHNIVI